MTQRRCYLIFYFF